MVVRHTASFKLNRILAAKIKALCGDPIEGGCIPCGERRIKVEMNGGEFAAASIARLVWALANWPLHLAKDEEAVHTCGNTGDPGTACYCVNPEHLMKADAKVRQAVASHTRRKGKVLGFAKIENVSAA